MYCLNCGTKISDDELQCPNCGSSVASMKERIAKAEEMVAYTDAVDPSVTSKMPLVSERSTDNLPAGHYKEVGPRGGEVKNGHSATIGRGDRLPPTSQAGNKWKKTN